MTEKTQQFNCFGEFYPFYLREHSNPICRALHLVGTNIAIVIIVLSIVSGSPKSLIYAPLVGYSLAWIGHFVFQKNKPATFKFPIYSLMGDFKMWGDFVTGQLSL